MKKLLTIGLKSKVITPEDDVMDCLKKALPRTERSGVRLQERVQYPKLQEKDVIVIASKVVAVTQGRLRPATSQTQFGELVRKHSDTYIGGKQVTLTRKNGIFTPWAGIDRSNAPKGQVVLWPDQPFKKAYKLQKELKKYYKLKNLGVVISDSICVPLRKGTVAIAIGYAGFKGVNDLRGTKDIHGKKMEISRQAIADTLATTAQMVMGESNECIPFALIRGADVKFTNKKPDPLEPIMDEKECIYAPLYKNFIDNKK